MMVLGFVLGLVLAVVLVWVPMKRKVKVLQRALELDSAQKMERILKWESYLRKEREKTQILEQDLKFAKARTLALESDLERVQSKYLWKE
jgi:hypothetical protein